MTGWFEVAVIAFVAQLTVLPGEKVQFIVAGLSTRYHPLLVVSAAGSAFAGWTALEVVFGSYLQTVLSGTLLDAFTGVLFLFFAVMLYRSAPDPGATIAETDGGVVTADGDLDVRVPVFGWKVPDALGGFLPVFALMAFGEFGDKTQLVTIGLAAQFARPTAIWAGEMAAIIPVTLVNAYFFHRFSHRFDLRKAHLAGAALFAFFGVDTLQATVTGVSAWETTVTTLGEAIGTLVVAAV